MEQEAQPRTHSVAVPVRLPGQGRTTPFEPGTSAAGAAAASPGFEPAGGTRGEHPHHEPGPPCPARRLPERLSLRDQVLRGLRDALVTGELRPGTVYSAPALAERFDVSATPVREAMQQLVREGAVEVVQNRGFRVAERTARDLAELAEVRALIEVPVMLRLARTMPAERWEALRPLARASVEAAAEGDRAGYAEADRAFHRALLSLAGNSQLVGVADQLHRRAQWPVADPHAGTRRAPGPADLLADAAEHEVLLDALIAGDLPTVESLVREHFSAGA
ncbi:GntR family transcriptional regulator [Streptantibioticus ferralitis]|uniref:GntR family transcriptional regulator n=1 Tax=Streptantibioticus ferralitis TaxID=236510 RepID=A0ABT5Z4B3_9ACTN|nr:GntR family transcriptional regulator [Streptantibioticus ferralitis]MDF2258664.1 GntR family transcriptional regulator [Streptantibioticus ferralitis]